MRKSIIKNISLGIACLLAVGGSIAAASAFNVDKPFVEVHADGAIEYISRSWDDANKEVVDTSSTCETYTIVASDTTSWTDGGWYVVSGGATIESRVNVAGTANLILCDGATLTLNNGISVNNGNTLNIYGQSEGTGSIVATTISKRTACIGGNEDRACGTISIHGGTITATGPTTTSGPGIGGGNGGDGGSITIYGGNITANAGRFAAAIGGGYARGAGTIAIYGGNIAANGGPQGAGIGCSADIESHPGGTITINGGRINAIGGLYAAGIGGGAFNSNDPEVTITINGGDITAIGGENAAGIGGGFRSSAGTVTINDGKVVATGGGNGAYGIGKGSEATSDGTLIVNNNDLNVLGNDSETPVFPTDAKTATEYQSNGWRYMIVDKIINYQAWDGTSVTDVESGCLGSIVITEDSTDLTAGWYVANSNITIPTRITVTGEVHLILCDGCILTANDGISVNEGNTLNLYAQSEGENAGKLIANTPNGVCYYAVIGGDLNCAAGTINIHGGNIEARTSGDGYGAAIGGGHNGAAGNITIHGGDITAASYYAAAIGGGAYYTAADGNITINGGTINAQCYGYGAGIGGGDQGPSGNIVINGGDITATANLGGAGIGGGEQGAATTIIINNGSITANGGYGAGIGGGSYAAGGDITINGGTLSARSRYYGAGIGGGNNAAGGNIVIKNGNISAYGGNGGGDYSDTAAGIGGGYNGAGANVTIYDGYITATGGMGSVGIGAGKNNTNHGTLNIVDETKLSVYGSNTYKYFPPIEKVNNDYERLTYMRVKYPHAHIWSYVADGNVITATCSAEDCYVLEEARTLTLVAEDLVFDGTAKSISFASGYSAEAFAALTISYYKGGVEVEECINVGTYEARVTIGGATATKEFTIAQATPTPDIPAGLAATYGDALSSVALPSGWAWKNPEDSVGNAGSREHNAIYTPTDPNYKSVELTITVSVSQATPTPEVPTGLVATYGDALSSVALPANWSWEAPNDEVGDVGDRTHVAIYTPTDPNYKAVEANIIISVAQAAPTPEVPTGLVATYGDKLSSVALPANWAWKAPTDEVGDVGDRTHVAIYTPTDPNYKPVELTLTVSVAQAAATPEVPTGLVATYGDKLSSVALPANWSWKAPNDEVGDVGDRTHVAIYTPTDPNYKAVEANIIISVGQATPTPDIPTGLAATYGDELSSVALPSGWAWKNPEDLVGNAGNREHIAIYTPADPNYKAVEIILTVAVDKANPSVPTLDTIEAPCGVALSTIGLPEGFSWMDGEQITTTLGKNTFKAKYTPADQDNYNVIENIDVKVNVKWTLADPTQGDVNVTINGDNEVYTADISVKVEVKGEVTVEEKRNEYASLATEGFVNPNEDISAIYGVKLIRTTNGVEEEIQPSDIEPGTKITVTMAIPEELVGKDFRLLHIYNGDDITEVTDYVISEDGKTLTIEVDRLSEFAFIGATDKDNGFIYNSTPVWAVILLIISSIILLAGIYCLYRLIKDRNGNPNNGDKSVKTMSIAFVSPILLAYSGLNGVVIAFIVVASLAVIVWAANLCLFIFNKKKKKKSIDTNNSIETEDEVKPVEETINDSNEDEIEVETITDEKGNVFNIRFIKSFTAKLIQSPEETKKYYEELKNEVLSYKKTNSRVSWHYDAVNAGREYVLKFAIRGKTLCVYLPLNADDYADSKYKVEKVESKKYLDVPCLYRIKNDRRLGYAKELIAAVANNLGLERGEEQHEIYSNFPYEPNKPLLERGLIKELKIQVNKPAETATETNEDEEESVTITDESGNTFNIRFVKSFTAKLIQSPQETKRYYEELKNEVLSYKKANSRISWHYDAVNAGREYVLKFAIRGKTLCVYLPLNADDYADSKYKVEKVESRKYQDVPCLYRIKNDRRLGYAKELIAAVANNLGLERGEEQHEIYSDLPYEPNKPLLERGLIKEVKVQVNKPAETATETKEDEDDNEVVVSQDDLGNKYETRFIKSFTAKLSQASDEVKDYYNELKNHALSYKGTSSRVSWNYDTISVGNKGILKFVIKRKNLYLYYALDTSKIGQKYHVEHVEYKKYEGVPTMLIIDSDRRKGLSKELIDRLMRQIKCELDHNLNDDYRVPFESKEVLIKKGLIKEVKVEIQ